MGVVDELDELDRAIVGLLAENARRTIGDIASRAAVSPSAARRRIERLERLGVIAGYTVVLDHAKAGRPIQAFTEVRFAGLADLDQIRAAVSSMPEVQSVFTTAGDADALVWLRAPDVAGLGGAIEKLRRSGRVTATKTLIVLDSWEPPRQGPGE